jgi:hypothetical protein
LAFLSGEKLLPFPPSENSFLVVVALSNALARIQPRIYCPEIMSINFAARRGRVARLQKSPIWVNFAGSCNRRCWYILWPFCIYYLPFGIFYGHLVYIAAICYILRSFGLYYHHLVYFMAIWSILPPFGIFYGHLVYIIAIFIFYGHLVYIIAIFIFYGHLVYIFFLVLVCCTKKNLATLARSENPEIYEFVVKNNSRTAIFWKTKPKQFFFVRGQNSCSCIGLFSDS